MNKVEEQLNKLGKEINSSYLLKKDERVRIFSHVVNNSHDPESIPSPYSTVLFPKVFFMNRASMFLLVVLMFTGVLSYSAETALPGDTLYAVKTQFNENLQSLLTFSPESKAKLEATLAEKRLVEVQKLTFSDKTSVNKDELQEGFKRHTDGFKKSIQELSVKDPSTAVTLSSDFQVILTNHKNLLNSLNKNSTTTDSTSDILSSEILVLDDIQKQLAEEVSMLSESQIKILAEEKASSTMALFELVVSDMASTSVVFDEKEIESIKDIINKGVLDMVNQNYLEAFISFQKSLRDLQSFHVKVLNTEEPKVEDSLKSDN